MSALISFVRNGQTERTKFKFDSLKINEREREVTLSQANGVDIPLSDISSPVLISGSDEVIDMIHTVTEQWQRPEDKSPAWDYQLADLDYQLLDLKVAIKINEIARHVAAEQNSLTNRGEIPDQMVPVVFKANSDGRLRVGWNFAKLENAKVGHRFHYDHGVGIHRNEDAEILFAAPLSVLQIQLHCHMYKSEPVHAYALSKNGEVEFCRFQIDHNGQLRMGNSVPTIDLNDIVGIGLLPNEQAPVWKPSSERPDNGEKIVAWDTDKLKETYSGPYFDHGAYDASGKSNKRYQGYTGAMVSGEPWSTKQSWCGDKDMVDTLRIHPFIELTNELTNELRLKQNQQQSQAVEQNVSSGLRPRR